MITSSISAVFLDRDGTLIHEREYLKHPDEVELFPETSRALLALQNGGFKLIIVTNQSGVGRGYFTMEDVDKVHAHLLGLLGQSGVKIDRIYVAPEAPDQPGRGRKPSPQFLFEASHEFGINLDTSYMIGDKQIDLACGWNAGVRKSLLVRTGYGAECEKTSNGRLPNSVVVDDLVAAAEWILTDSKRAMD